MNKPWFKQNTNLSQIAFQLAKGAELHPHLLAHFIEELIEAKNKNIISLTPQMLLETYKFELNQRICHRNPRKKRRIAG